MDTIIGIDLGTTNSEVAVFHNGQVRVLDEGGDPILPSVVGVSADGTLLVGWPAHNQAVLAPERTVRSIKRKMGQDTTVRLGDQEYTPQEVSAIILRTLKTRAENALGHRVTKAVITVPAFFSDSQRQATREAGELAGLEVVRILNEPTAAALTYDPHPEAMERLLVYDLGGGTFDVSVVQIEKGVVEVLSSHGDTQLGGDDIDARLLESVADAFANEHGIDLRQSLVARSRLLRAVEDAKKALSIEAVAVIAEEFIAEKDGAPLHLRHELERYNFETQITPLLEKTLRRVDQALADAKLQANQIDKVILAGGATRMPIVHRLLQERLGQPVHGEVEPDLCVAMGAAIQAGLIAGLDVGPILVDITPHTLGIETLGELDGMESSNCFSPILTRGAALPAKRTEVYTTVYDGQEKVLLRVFQGDDPNTRNNELVGEFAIEGLADVAAPNQILVRFELDLNGILKASATERTTGLNKQVTIDSYIERFRKSRGAKARDRLADAFATDPIFRGEPVAEGQVVSASADDGLTPAATAVFAKANEMLRRGESLVTEINAEDARELDNKLTELRAALQQRSEPAITAALATIEDLLFYLEDA